MRGTCNYDRMNGPAAWLLAIALAVFAVPIPASTCPGMDADTGSCCGTGAAEATGCCASDVPLCCYDATDLPDAVPLAARDLVPPNEASAHAFSGTLPVLHHTKAPSRLAATAPPTGGARRHAVLCLMLI